VAGMLGTIQAVEVLKFLLGTGELLTNTLLSFDAKTLDFRKTRFKKNAKCAVCGTQPTIRELQDEAQPVCNLKPGGRS